MTVISDERLAEIVADKNNFYRDEIKSMARELQSLRVQGGVGSDLLELLDEVLDEDAPNKDVWKTSQTQHQWLTEKILPLLRDIRALRSSLEASPAPVSEHPDDMAVDHFAAAMKEKLAKKRAEGRSGWNNKSDCSSKFLSKLLREHVEKGDPLDVGNLAMMLHQRGDKIATRDQVGAWVEAEADRNAGLPR